LSLHGNLFRPVGRARSPTKMSCITSKTRAPTSFGVGASHGEASKVVRASERPRSQGASIVARPNS
jgi:hypothetical protein